MPVEGEARAVCPVSRPPAPCWSTSARSFINSASMAAGGGGAVGELCFLLCSMNHTIKPMPTGHAVRPTQAALHLSGSSFVFGGRVQRVFRPRSDRPYMCPCMSAMPGAYLLSYIVIQGLCIRNCGSAWAGDGKESAAENAGFRLSLPRPPGMPLLETGHPLEHQPQQPAHARNGQVRASRRPAGRRVPPYRGEAGGRRPLSSLCGTTLTS